MSNKLIKNYSMTKRIEDSYKLYDEIEDLFSDDKKRSYLTTIISVDDLTSLFEEFTACFISNGDAYKCIQIEKWKKITETM